MSAPLRTRILPRVACRPCPVDLAQLPDPDDLDPRGYAPDGSIVDHDDPRPTYTCPRCGLVAAMTDPEWIAHRLDAYATHAYPLAGIPGGMSA